MSSWFSRISSRLARKGPDRPAPPGEPEVAFGAFAADCRLHGWISLRTPRLSDMLNGSDPLVLSGVVVEGLVDGRIVDVGALTVERSELCAVVIDGPRGDPARRLRTRTARVEIEVGPYRIEASLHGPPAADPLHAVMRRADFVPVTDATVRYVAAGAPIVEVHRALLVNRPLATSLRAGDEPRLPVPSGGY